MLQLNSVISQLRAFSTVASSGKLAFPLNAEAELEGLESRLMLMRDRASSRDASPPANIDITALRARWQRVAPDISVFSRRELRALCWDTSVGSDVRFARAIQSRNDLAANTRILRGLWFVHERKWRTGAADIVEDMVLSREGGGGLIPRWMRALWERPNVLTAAAPTALAALAAADWRDAKTSLSRMSITQDGELGVLAIEQMVRNWVDDVCRGADSTSTVSTFDAGYDGLLIGTKMSASLFKFCVENLAGAVNKLGRPYRERVAGWIVSDLRLGHPARKLTRPNWSGISEATRQLAVQLFAARDLGAFFQVLIGTGQDEQDRRPFWERYVESRQLMNFAIASDWSDRQKLIAALGKDRAQVARLVDAPSDHSAFLMHFKGRADIVIAEMSKAGNAMYMYLVSDFERHVGELQDSTFAFAQLKDKGLMQERLTHRGEWHSRFDAVLRQYGVYP